MTHVVRWVEAAAALPEHFASWQRNLSNTADPLRRLQWMYRDNPGGPGRLAVLEAHDDAGAFKGFVGTAGCVTRAISDGGRALLSAVLCDVTVDEGHRLGMAAFTMVREVRRYVLERYDLAYGFPNHLSEPVVVRAYKKLGHMSRFALVLRHRRHVDAKVGSRALAWGVARALDTARAALVLARAAPAAVEHRVVTVAEGNVRVDDRFDQLWREAAPSYGILGVRDRAFIDWRYHRRAGGNLTVLALEHRKTGALAGYAVVEPVGDAWHVRDLFAHPASFPALLDLVSFELLTRGASSISLSMAGPPAARAALGALGFRERADKRTFICGVGKGEQQNASRLLDIKHWYLTEADEDT